MKITELLDLNQLSKLVMEGCVSMRKHPHLPLFIYNAVNCEKCPEIARRCRGLVVDFEGNLVINCPTEGTISVNDDSYVAVSMYHDSFVVASRSSFEDRNVERAKEVLARRKEYQLALVSLCKDASALFELRGGDLHFLGTIANFETTEKQLWTPAHRLVWPGHPGERVLH